MLMITRRKSPRFGPFYETTKTPRFEMSYDTYDMSYDIVVTTASYDIVVGVVIARWIRLMPLVHLTVTYTKHTTSKRFPSPTVRTTGFPARDITQIMYASASVGYMFICYLRLVLRGDIVGKISEVCMECHHTALPYTDAADVASVTILTHWLAK